MSIVHCPLSIQKRGDRMRDDEILDLFFSRDEKALNEIKTLYGKLLQNVARNITGNVEDAEEIENEVYMKAWNAIPPSRPERLCAYLCKIARRLAINRRNYLNASKRGGALPLDELGDAVKSSLSAEDLFSERELAALLDRFLDEQDYNTRVIFMRRYWFGQSIDEIARSLHASRSMVKSRVSRTMIRLREFLRAQGYELPDVPTGKGVYNEQRP